MFNPFVECSQVISNLLSDDDAVGCGVMCFWPAHTWSTFSFLEYTDEDGRKGIRVKFYLQGVRKRATAHLDAREVSTADRKTHDYWLWYKTYAFDDFCTRSGLLISIFPGFERAALHQVPVGPGRWSPADIDCGWRQQIIVVVRFMIHSGSLHFQCHVHVTLADFIFSTFWNVTPPYRINSTQFIISP